MWIITAIRDFAGGLSSGVSLFLNERKGCNACLTVPEAEWPKYLHQHPAGTAGSRLK